MGEFLRHSQFEVRYRAAVGIKLLPSGDFLVVYRGCKVVIYSSADGHVVREFGSSGLMGTDLKEPADVAASRNYVFVLERSYRQLHVIL